MYRTPTLVRAAISRCNSTRAVRHLRLTTPFAHATTPRYTTLKLQPRHTAAAVRYNSSLTVPESDDGSSQTPTPPPAYHLVFTCKPCTYRSGHNVSKQAYHHGTVLITCPSCKNRHVISDHLKIFMDEKSTLEDILRRTTTDGDLTKLLKKGVINPPNGSSFEAEEQDFEFWDDNSKPHTPYGLEDKK